MLVVKAPLRRADSQQEESMGVPMHRLIEAAIVAALVVAGQVARADAVQDLAAAAAKKGSVIWYESSPPEAIIKIAAAFNKRYPDINIQFVRNTGGGGIAARIIQESEAGAATASFFSPHRNVPLGARQSRPCPVPSAGQRWPQSGVSGNEPGMSATARAGSHQRGKSHDQE
jgi:hypothetical protein